MSREKRRKKAKRKQKSKKRRDVRLKMGKPVFLNLCRTPKALEGFSNKYMYKANLYKVVYTSAKFFNVRWNASNITHCTFKKSHCKGVDFFNSNLKETSFQNSILDNVVFFNCNLSNTNFKGATFKRVIFISTNIAVAKNLTLSDECIIYKSYPNSIVPVEWEQRLFELYNFGEFSKYKVLFVSKDKLNLWIIKIFLDYYGHSALKALVALKNRKYKENFYTVFSFMQHIEKYMKL